MKLTAVCVLLGLTGCVIPPELAESRAEVGRLEAKMLQNEAKLAEASESLSKGMEDLEALRVALGAVRAAQSEPGLPEERSEALATQVSRLEERIRLSEDQIARDQARAETYAEMAATSREALSIAREAESKWQEVADNLTKAKVARYAETGVKLGDSLFGSVIPWLQTLLPGLGGLGIAAGVWETIRRRREQNGKK